MSKFEFLGDAFEFFALDANPHIAFFEAMKGDKVKYLSDKFASWSYSGPIAGGEFGVALRTPCCFAPTRFRFAPSSRSWDPSESSSYI